ncbi:HAD family hydrolase [Afifella sp. IM 167]|uniref:HAD-IIB family hydrolase n=1 Tax=Afifella sp. IM 167 TaxID=2033586 RepID=UPI001CC8FC37|nr:HAD family hydrolase [Afifella sp. IM 167]MBZ8131988.1 phosphoglycolate phosphatase [Afifella sp. IM 167]
MYFLALATDYDGTLAEHGAVTPETCQALARLKASGRRLILVTGRELADLRHAFARLDLFDVVVAENGAVLYEPASGREQALAPPPPSDFVHRLIDRGVAPISVGRCVLATWEPHETTVLSVIHEMGLELQIAFNKGAVMVLPPGVNKASGLAAALALIDIAPHSVVAVGDAENDHAFLKAAGCAAAVANALPVLKASADIVLGADHGAGVAELIARILQEDLDILPPERLGLFVGSDPQGEPVYLEADRCALVVGPSGAGKSQLGTLLAERMVERGFEFCIFDPEGDYEALEHAVTVGDRVKPPSAAEVMRLLRETGVNVVVNAVALGLAERESLFAEMLPAVAELKARSGRPQWIIVDEAHHVLPATAEDMNGTLKGLPATVFLTIGPNLIAESALKEVDAVLAFGRDAPATVSGIAQALGRPPPHAHAPQDRDEVLFWDLHAQGPARLLHLGAPHQAHRRHKGKYVAGDVGEWQAFWFRGPDRAVSLPARNLSEFLQIGFAVDDATWNHHLIAGDYTRWFRAIIKDEELARQAEALAAEPQLSPAESRERLRAAITRRYATGEGG